MWDERYSSAERVWSGEPNPWLVEVASGMVPGTALDLGCGEGADAMWLSRAGWQVTGVDFSAEALRRAAAAAGSAEVDWVQADLSEWQPDRQYDLVSVQFFHGDPDVRVRVHQEAWRATAGTLVVVGHDDTHPGRPPAEVRYGTADILAALQLEPGDPSVVVAEVRVRGDAVDAVVVARR